MIESDLIRESVRKLRVKDQNIKKKFSFDGRMTFWDSDKATQELSGVYVKMRLPDGDEFIFTGDTAYRNKNFMILTPECLVTWQFMDKESIKLMIPFYKTFNDDGVANIGEYDSVELKAIKEYCVKMEDAIRKEANSLRNAGIKQDIFLKMWREMGGEKIQKDDHLGNRVRFLGGTVLKFKENKSRWTKEMKRLQLMG